jgi:NTP pyrophosphatase (non-canonical NTP hydrolase)
METKELQKRAAETVDMVDKKFKLKRDAQLNLAQMMEEIGELAKEVNLPVLRNKERDKENLEGEFGDVFLQLSKLADLTNVDLEQATLNKIEILKKRHGLG